MVSFQQRVEQEKNDGVLTSVGASSGSHIVAVSQGCHKKMTV